MNDTITFETVLAAEPGTVFVYHTGVAPQWPPASFSDMRLLYKQGLVLLFQRVIERDGRNPAVLNYEAHRVSLKTFDRLQRFHHPI